MQFSKKILNLYGMSTHSLPSWAYITSARRCAQKLWTQLGNSLLYVKEEVRHRKFFYCYQ